MIAGLLPAATAFMMMGCTAELKENRTEETAVKGTPVTLYVQDNEWLPEDGAPRSVYEPGVGIHLTGTENISLYYYDGTQYVGDDGTHGIIGAPTGGGAYSFTNPGAQSGAKWYSLMPYSYIMQRVAPTKDIKYQYAQTFIGPVQYPGDDTFDPQADVLLGKPFVIEGGVGTITAFKRMVAPWRITITGLESTDKIYYANVSVAGNANYSTDCLAGSFSINFSDTFDGVTLRGVGSATKSRTISAYYGNGLSRGSEGWPIWLMVNPITIASGTEITLTVATKDKLYKRTAVLPSQKELYTDKINKLTFNIKGTGVESEDILIQDFSNITPVAGNNALTTADGTEINWLFPADPKWDSSTADPGSQNQDAIYSSATGSVFIIPSIPSKSLKKLRLIIHPCSALNSSGITVELMDGARLIHTYNASTVTTSLGDGAYVNGGALDIDVPDGYESLSGLALKCAKGVIVSGAVLFCADPIDYDGDYYTAFAAGKSILIGGKVYQKDTPHTFTSIPVTNQAALEAAAANFDVIFLDGGSSDNLNITSDLTIGGKAIIGRYMDRQPSITVTSNSILPSGDLSFKNICFKYGRDLFYTTNASFALDIEDCTCQATATDKGFIYDKDATNCITNLFIRNSVFLLNSTKVGVLYMANTKTSAELPNIKTYKIENNVFCNSNTLAAASWRLISVMCSTTDKTNVATPNLDFTFTGNTVYNWSSRMVSVHTPNRFSFCNNLLEGSISTTTYAIHVGANGNNKNFNSYVANNWARSNGSMAWTLSSSGYVTSSNNTTGKSDTLGDPLLGTTNTSIGYLPINTSVVTNGAGATYSTKLWRTWE